MSAKTRLIGYIVLGLTEIIIGALFILCPEQRAQAASLQTVVFGGVWGLVGYKNYVDMKKNGNGTPPEEVSQ